MKESHCLVVYMSVLIEVVDLSLLEAWINLLKKHLLICYGYWCFSNNQWFVCVNVHYDMSNIYVLLNKLLC